MSNPYEYTPAKAPYTLGDGPVTVLCDRDKSYRITRALPHYETDTAQGREKTIVSIPCDRADTADNDRGFVLATLLADAINAAQDADNGSALLGQVERELESFGMKQTKQTTLRESTGYDEGEALVYFSATSATPDARKWIDSLHSKYGHKIDVGLQGIGSEGVLWTIAETPKA